jgi:LacI family gluconate utilization system Gnt-I transcriptional repressor
VAEKAGVSPMTVSRALQNPGKLSDETLNHVRSVVAELGYVPDQLARSMSRTGSNIVAVIIPRLNNPANAEIFRGLDDGLSNSGMSLFLGTSGSSLEAEERLVTDVWGWRPAAIVLCALQHTAVTSSKLKSANIPVVDITDLGASRIDMIVGTSHGAAAEAIVSHLQEAGYASFGYVHVSLPNHVVFRRRMEGYLGACRDLGVTNMGVTTVEDVSVSSGREAARLLLEQPDLPDVVICTHDLLAIGMLQEMARQGVDVPGRIGIVGFEDIKMAADMYPSLTTVRVDAYMMGRQVADNILKKLSGEDAPLISDIGYQIIVRESTSRKNFFRRLGCDPRS